MVNITGGTVVATGGDVASGRDNPDDIGLSGFSGYSSPTKQFYPLTIKGASVHATHRTASNECVEPAPSNGTERVWCVTVETQKTNELVNVKYINGFGDGSGIYTDENGKIYLWLPNGTYVFYVDDLPFTTTVRNADATATAWFTGVLADGVDVSFAGADGKKWAYDFGTKTLYVNGDCVISGTNTAGYVNILAGLTEEDEGGGTGTVECSFTISNLYLKATSRAKASPITVKEGTVTVCLAGTNRLDATETDSFAGLNVVQPATLAITNLEADARLEAYSGEDAAAIGGNQNKESGVNYTTGTICIRGGGIYAQAKDSGAGIGSGYKGSNGDIYISGGQIDAFGGRYSYSSLSAWCGAGIGGGDSATGSGRSIVISGGTVRAMGGYEGSSKYAADIGTGYKGEDEYRVEISGGSVRPVSNVETHNFNQSESGHVYPSNGDGSRVYRAVLDGLAPDAKVEMEMPGYGVNDIYADFSGRIFLWLANGVHYYRVNGQRYAMRMTDGTATIVAIPDSYGVEVDGVDVANLTGDMWSYDVFACQLSVTNACVISGTNTDGKVNISVDATEEFALTVSNLYLKAANGSPIMVLRGTNTLCLAGTNVLDATGAAGYPGLHVASMYEGVVITNLHDGAKLIAKGGANAAGIGGDNSRIAGMIEITGGIVEATGGANGAGIGGGSNAKGYVYISGGTVVPMPGSGSAKSVGTSSGGQVRFTGGSISTVASLVNPAAVNGSNVAVWPVTVTGLKTRSGITFDGLPPNYGTNGICADGAGEICLWLPNGDYVFMATDEDDTVRRYRAHVNDAAADAEDFVLKGFTVNGVDVAYLSGEGWSYDDDAVSGRITLSGRDHYELSGTLTNKFLNISNSCSIVFSNAVFNSYNVYGLRGIMNIAGTYDVSLTLIGENKVKAPTGGGIAGIMVPKDASLVIGGDGSLTADAGENAAGIGGAKQIESGSITVNGGTVTATGGNYAAGIGGGYDAGCGPVTVNGGTVTATGGRQGAGIGGGAFTGGTSVGGTYGGDIVITGGVVVATGGDWAAGIGGGEQSSGGSVTVKGGKITAQGGVHGPAIGACGSAGTYGDVTISGGTIVTLTNEYSIALGRGRDTASMGHVTILGGSIDAASYSIDPAPSNSVACVSRVAVTNLTPNAAVAFDGLPPYYGTSGICADDSGSVYLWLPEDWTTPVTPRLHSASPRLGGASPGTTHTFSANGYRYTVTIPVGGGEVVAEQGAPLELEDIRITGFAVEGGSLLINVTAAPGTWLYGFIERLDISASAALPIPDTEESTLDLSAAEYHLESDGSATIVVPLVDDSLHFFKVKLR